MKHNTTCPRCKGPVPSVEHAGEYPGALSRLDNETEICSECGTLEALFNLTYPGQPLPPVDEALSSWEYGKTPETGYFTEAQLDDLPGGEHS